MPKPQQTQARTENEKPKMGMGPALTSKQERRLQFKEIEPAIDFFKNVVQYKSCLLYTSPSPRDRQKSRMPSSA